MTATKSEQFIAEYRALCRRTGYEIHQIGPEEHAALPCQGIPGIVSLLSEEEVAAARAARMRSGLRDAIIAAGRHWFCGPNRARHATHESMLAWLGAELKHPAWSYYQHHYDDDGWAVLDEVLREADERERCTCTEDKRGVRRTAGCAMHGPPWNVRHA